MAHGRRSRRTSGEKTGSSKKVQAALGAEGPSKPSKKPQRSRTLNFMRMLAGSPHKRTLRFMTEEEDAEDEETAMQKALRNRTMRPKAQDDHTTAQADLKAIPDAPNASG